ncbi:MAG: hypothetical protein LC772_02135 [Chloroflexi bacterium]|nr:hypothetical protein [Chloroflexota bacterium]
MVQSALVKAPGVVSATVTRNPDRATVVYNTKATTPQKLVQAVDNAHGMAHYTATLK